MIPFLTILIFLIKCSACFTPINIIESSPRRPACPQAPFGRPRPRRPASPSCPRRAPFPGFVYPRAPVRIAASLGGGAAPGAACFPGVRRSPAARRSLLACLAASRTSAARSLQSLAMLRPSGGCLFPGLGLCQPLPVLVGLYSCFAYLRRPVATASHSAPSSGRLLVSRSRSASALAGKCWIN